MTGLVKSGGRDRRAIVGSVATGVAGQAALVASGVVVARVLGVEGRGQLALIVLIPSVLSQIGTLGAPLALTYHLARDEAEGVRLLRSLRPLVLAQVLILSLLQIPLFAVLTEGVEREAVLMALPVMPALIAQQYGLAVLQGRQRFGIFNLLRVAPASLYATAVVVAVTMDATGLVDLVVAWTIVNLAVGVPLAVVTVRASRSAERRSTEQSVGSVLRFGTSALIGSSSPSEILRIEQVVIALSLSRTALGLYVVAVAFTNLPRFISQSVGMVAYPRVARARPSERRQLVRSYVGLVFLTAGTVVVFLELTIAWLLPALFGDEFNAAVTTSQLLLGAGFLLAVRRVLTDVSQGLGHPGHGAIAEVINLAVALPLVAAVAPRYGIEGAAVALIVGAAASLGVLIVLVRQGLGHVDEGRTPVEPLSAAGVALERRAAPES